jgi:hypothetical protein
MQWSQSFQKLDFTGTVCTGNSSKKWVYADGDKFKGNFQGVQQQRRGVNHLPPSSVKIKERVEL